MSDGIPQGRIGFVLVALSAAVTFVILGPIIVLHFLATQALALGAPSTTPDPGE